MSVLVSTAAPSVCAGVSVEDAAASAGASADEVPLADPEVVPAVRSLDGVEPATAVLPVSGDAAVTVSGAAATGADMPLTVTAVAVVDTGEVTLVSVTVVSVAGADTVAGAVTVV
jgi:hypothetical protein